MLNLWLHKYLGTGKSCRLEGQTRFIEELESEVGIEEEDGKKWAKNSQEECGMEHTGAGVAGRGTA